MQRKIRVLVGKPGLDGHDRGAKVVAAALRDAGMEVVYTGLHQTPEQIVEAAVQEDVDVVALSILSGAHMTLFPEVLELMRERGIGDRLLTGGGIIPSEDMETLAGRGVGRLFGPGASTQDIAVYVRGWFAGIHGAESLAPMPERPVLAPVVPPSVPVSRRAHAPARRKSAPRLKRASKPKRVAAKAKAASRKKAKARPKPARKAKASSRKAKGARAKSSSRRPASKAKARR